MKKRKKISIIVAAMIIGIMAAFIPGRTEAAVLQLGEVHSVHVSENDIQSFEFHEEMSEEEFRKESRVSESGMIMFAVRETIYDTGLFKTTLKGMPLKIYEAFEAVSLSPSNNAVSISIDGDGMSSTEVYNMLSQYYAEGMYAYYYDHLEEFYWNSFNGIGLGLNSDGANYEAQLHFMVSPYYSDSVGAAASAKVDQAVAELQQYQDDYETFYQINKWVVDHCEYDSEAADSSGDTENDYYAHSMTGLLVRGKGVCETYAKTFKILCQRRNLPCVVVVSATHAFNYVKLEGNWYMVDTTWNDSTGALTKYFLISNNPAIDSRAHVESGSLTYPVTSSSDYVKEESEHHWDSGIIVKEATCEEAGEMLFHCTDEDCEETRTTEIAALGHNYQEEDSTATCTEAGYLIQVCENCDQEIRTETAALGHDYSKYRTEVNEDYTACEVYGICGRCGSESPEKLTDGRTTVSEMEDPTCTEEGYVKVVNSFQIVTTVNGVTNTRNVTSRKTIYLEALGHSWIKGDTVAPTRTADGYTLYSCERCSEEEHRDIQKYVPYIPDAPKTVTLSNVSKGVKLKWSKVKDVKGYYIYRGTTKIGTISAAGKITSGSKKFAEVTVSSGTITCINTDAVNGKTYTYKIVPYSVDGKATKTSTKKICRLKSSPVTRLTAPGSGKLTVTYTKNTSVSGYEVQYDLKSDFSSAKKVTVKGSSTVKKTISKLKKGKTYRVRVRGYKTVNGVRYYSGWSEAKTVKVK